MTIRTIACRVANRLLFPVLPARRRLPFRHLLHCLEGGAEPEMLHMDRLCSGRGSAVDAGANLGFYSYRMSRLFRQVHAFEVNGSLLEDLAAYNPGNITVHPMGLSSGTGELTLYTPVLRGQALHGWASLTPDNCPDTREHTTQVVRVGPLDATDIRDVSFFKIDVEGHEAETLQGASATIARDRPVVLVEIKERNVADVRAFFQSLGYSETSLQKLAGIAGSSENHIFVPEPPP